MESIRAAAIEYETGLAMKKAREEYYEELRAKQEEEENKPLLEKIGDTVNGWTGGKFGENVRNAMGEVYGPGSEDMNPTTFRSLGKIEDVISEIPGDFVNAATEVGKTRQNFWHNVSNMQQAYLDAQATGDFSGFNKAVDETRNAGREASVALTNVMASPVRSAARNFIKLNADNPASPYQSLAQSLQMTDVGIEYFTTDEEHLQKSREIEEALGLPPESTLADNAAFKEALEMYYFKQKYDNIEYVWEEYPELKNIASMDKEAAAIALHNIHTVKESHSTIDTFITFLGKGNRELELNNIQFKIAEGKATDEEIKRAEELKKEIAQDKAKAPGFFQDPLGAMAAGVAESLPEMGQSVAGGVAGGGAAATAITLAAVAATVLTGGTDLLVAGGIAGARTMIMRALASQGGKQMLKTWATTGAVAGMYAPEEGQRYGEYKEMKKKDGTPLYTDKQARYYASAGAAANSVLEIVPTFAVAGKALPVATRVFQQSAESIVRQSLGRETLKDIGVAAAGNWLKITATESGEEALQSVADDVIRNIALESKGKDADHYQQYSVGDILTRAGAAFVESLPASMAFGFAGVGGSAIAGAGRAARGRKRAAEMENTYGKQQAQTMMGAMMVEQLQKTVKDGKLNKVAPDVQKKVIREQLKGTGFENAWIDIEMAMQKETGREDLKKIADAQGMSADALETAITSNGYMSVPTETLSQLDTSPDILDSVSFTPEAESMARMRVNGKKIVDEYNKNMQKAVERQLKLADTIIDNYIPAENDEHRKKQREVLKAVMLQNLQNPAQGWNELYKIYNDELQERIAPALEALKKGMGNAGLLEVQDEQGNTRTQRYTENDEWYRNFYKIHKRKPTQAELQDMAIAMTLGDSSAPKVAGWVPDSAETQAAMEQERPVIETLKQNIDLLNSVKAEAKKMTGVEMELTEGFSPEAFKVYRAISSWAEKAGGKIARAGRMTALLWARHADIVADIITKKTGQKYTAEDYIRKHLLLELVKDGNFGEGLKQLAGINARGINAQQLKTAKEMEAEGDDMDIIFKETGWLKGADGKWRFEIPDNLDKISWQEIAGNKNNGSLWQVYDNERLYDAYPWLASVPVKLVDLAEGHNGRVTGSVYNYIEINRNISDDEKNKTLVHEIQHLIQDKEGFASGGNTQQVRQQIQGQVDKLRRKLAGIPQAEEYMRVSNDFFVAIESGNQESLDKAWEEQARLEKEIPESTRNEIDNLSLHLNNLEKALQDETSDYRLYMNLAGEQKARNTAARAKYMTEFRKAVQEQTKAQLAYEQEVKKQPREMLEKLRELQQLEAENGNSLAIEKLRLKLTPDLLEAYDNRDVANWMVEDKKEYLNTPMPHNENAIVVFDGQEMAMEDEPRYNNMSEEAIQENIQKGRDAIEKVLSSKENFPMAMHRDDTGDIDFVWGTEGDPERRFKGGWGLSHIIAHRNAQGINGYEVALILPEVIMRGKKRKGITDSRVEFTLGKYKVILSKNPMEGVTPGNHWLLTTFELNKNGDSLVKSAELHHPSDSTAPAPTVRLSQGRSESPVKNSISPTEEIEKSEFEQAVKNMPLDQLFQRAWHGTPHDFEKFDLGAIGTGEGAQAHGWGLYFAGSREVSQRYKEVLASGKSDIKIMFGDKQLPAFGFVDGLTEAENKAYKAIQSVGYEKDKAIALLRDIGEKEAADIVENAEVNYRENKGKLFEVEIPDNDVLLDEQKPLSQQPEKVKEAIINILAEKTTNEEIEELEYVQKEIIESKDLDKTAAELIENPFYEYSIISEESEKIFDLLREGKRSQGLLLTKQLIAELINGKNKVLDRVEKKYRNTSGKKLYDRIAYNPREASEKLNAAGVKGITYEGGQDGRCFVVFDDKAISIIEKYNQQVNGQERRTLGSIDIKPNKDGQRTIHILETANESTFMHEMAHMFLFDLEELAQIDNVSAKELETVNEWATWQKGAAKEYKGTDWYKDFADLEQAIIDAEEAGDYETADKKKAEWRQERFARGFEMYLKEGTAPARGLRAVFRKFKEFLRAIYKQFTSDGGKPTEAVRRVMDRMIATDEEIKVAALDDRYNDLAKAGGEKLFNEKDEETFKRWQEEELETAKERVMKLVMKDFERQKTKEFKAALEEEEERYTKELQQENIFLARRLLAETRDKESVRTWFDSVEEFEALDAVTPSMESLIESHMREYGEQLDKSMMEKHLNQEEIDKAMQSSKYRAKIETFVLRGMERRKELLNTFNSKAKEAIDAIEGKLKNLPEDTDFKTDKYSSSIKEIMNEITRLRFADKWDTEAINHIEAMMRASTQEDVRKAIKNLKERQRKKQQNIEDVESATKGMEKFYKEMVQNITAEKPMSETCNVNYYLNKERRAGERVKAMRRAKNWEGAINQQKSKVFYSMMVKQARENKEKRDKLIKDLERKLNARTVRLPKDERYWFNRLLYLIRINKAEPKVPEGGVAKLEDIFKAQLEAKEIMFVPENLIDIRDKGENYGDYNQLSLYKFQDVHDDLVRLYTLGRDMFNFKTIGGVSLEEAAADIQTDPTRDTSIGTITRNVGPDQGGLNYIETIGNLGRTGHDVAKGLQRYSISILKPEVILEKMGKKARKYIYGILEKAAEVEADLTEKNLRALQDINSMYTQEEHQQWDVPQWDFPGEKGWKLSKENVLMMAINYGSEKNRQRLIGGLIDDTRRKNEKSAQEVQKDVEALFKVAMTAKDWEYIQRLWDHIGSFWHDSAAVEEKLNGVALGRVEPMPFSIETADGKTAELRGGYMHIKFNFEKSAKAAEYEANDMANSIMAGAARLGAGRGMTKARSEQDIYRAVDLEFSVIEQHLQDVIHNIAYRVPVRDVYRLINYKNFKTGVDLEDHFRKTLGVEAYSVIKDWTLDTWRQVNENRNSAETTANHWFRMMRSHGTMFIMGWRLKPVIDNLGNIPIAMEKIGPVKMLAAMKDYYLNDTMNREEIMKRSAFMRTRALNLDRDLKSQPGVFRAGNKLLEFAKLHAYDMLIETDLAVSLPLWMSVYKDSITPKMEEVKKENDANMQKRIDLAAKVDEIKGSIGEAEKAAIAIDEHLHTRRYGKPEEIAALRGTEYAAFSEGELQARWGEHKKDARALGKELFKAEQELERAQQLPVYTNAEMQEEAQHRAVFEADAAIRDTFGSGRMIDQPAVMRSTNELVRLFTAFYSFFNAQYNALWRSYMKSKELPDASSIERWAPFAKTVFYRVMLSGLITSATAFALGLKGGDDDDKQKTVMGPDGKKVKQEVPWTSRFLKVYAQECLSIGVGGLYGIRDAAQVISDYAFSGKNYGYKMGSVATRGVEEVFKTFKLMAEKGAKDEEIQAKQEKKQREHEEKLAKLKGKKRREYLQKWEEEQQYQKPPKRITYPEIIGHGAKGVAAFTAARTGITSTMVNSITTTMDYMLDKDMRYDPTMKNVMWSILFDKKPVEREIPKKPEKEPKKGKKKNTNRPNSNKQ